VKTDPNIYEPFEIKYYCSKSDDNVYTNLLTIVDNTVELIEDTLKDGGMLFIVLATQ
jgi:hypothetical protein